jgi:hypothetical protein
MEVSSEVVCLGILVTAAAQMRRRNVGQEFFSDPSQWWDHRSEKVSEYDCCCHNSLVKGLRKSESFLSCLL